MRSFLLLYHWAAVSWVGFERLMMDWILMEAVHWRITELEQRTLGYSSLIASVLHAASSQYGSGAPDAFSRAIPFERRRQNSTLFTQSRGVQFSSQKSINNPWVSTPSTVSPTASTIICDYLCCCCCAPSSPGDEVKDGVVDGVVDAVTF